MTRYEKEIDKYPLRSKRFKQLKEYLHSRGIYKCSTKSTMVEAIKKYSKGLKADKLAEKEGVL